MVEVIICMITRDFSVISIDVTRISLSLSISLFFSQKSLTHNKPGASAPGIIIQRGVSEFSTVYSLSLSSPSLVREKNCILLMWKLYPPYADFVDGRGCLSQQSAGCVFFCQPFVCMLCQSFSERTQAARLETRR